MRIYFLSSQPAALYVGGAYFGKTHNFERFAEISLSDNLPVRFEAEGAVPLTFFLHERIPLSPPSGVDVYRLPTGLALFAHGFTPIDQTLTVVAQQRHGELLATVVKQGCITLGIESPNGFFNTTLPPSFAVCQLFFVGGCILVKSSTQVAVFSSFCRQLLLQDYLTADIDDGGISFTIPLSDRYHRTAECRYSITNGAVLQESYVVKQDNAFPEDGLIAYAFFESVRIGADFTHFLADDLPMSPEDVRSFLGAFLHVLPCDDTTDCLLVYKKSERLYDVRKCSVNLKDGKITDIFA